MASIVDKNKDANETFYEEGFARLRAGEMEESTGKLIMDLMEIRDDKALLPYARKWIKLFPRVESAPRLVGKWLQLFESNDAMYMATSYVKTYPDVNALILIARALAQLPKSPPKLLDAIEKRFSAEPNSHIWSSLQAFENSKSELDPLILRWLEINRYNPKLAVDVTYVANNSKDLEVLSEVFRWIDVNQDKCQDIWLVFTTMLMGVSDAHKQLLPRVAETASLFLKKNPDYAEAGRIYSDLLLAQPSVTEIQNARDWYLKHQDSKSARASLLGILRASKLLGQNIEPELVENAKRILEQQRPEERSPTLAAALLEAAGDSQSIALAKETWRHQKGFLAWFHALLLRIAPDEELIARANEIYARPMKGSPKVIIELLKIDCSNSVARRAAERWIKDNPGEKQIQELQSLLKV